MDVDATKGDLGEQDISKPRVAGVERDEHGNIKQVSVAKGVIFKKKLDIPADRIEEVDTHPQEDQSPGKVTIATGPGEIEFLTSVGEEELADQDPDQFLEQLEKKFPTVEGVREMEAANLIKQMKGEQPEQRRETLERLLSSREKTSREPRRSKLMQLLQTIGPGFLSGMSGNDATACTTYAIDGATVGFGHLWLMLLATPMYQAVQFACARIGRITQKGIAELLREHFGRWLSMLAALVLVAADLALVAGNLVAIGSGLELITGVSWVWFVVPVAAILWYITVFRNFETLKKIFIVMSFAFAAYLVTAFFSHANWGQVLFHTFVPQAQFNFADISAAVALLGATISPYSMFWQAQEEKEQERAGPLKRQLRFAAFDVASGTVGGNLVSYFIIVTTAATLFTHHQSINTAADAAMALGPLVGPFARYLFAVGLIGAGVIAVPVMLASTSYAVAGMFGWPSGLSRKPWQSEGFYLILTAAMLLSLGLALLRLNPIQLIFWANILVAFSRLYSLCTLSLSATAARLWASSD